MKYKYLNKILITWANSDFSDEKSNTGIISKNKISKILNRDHFYNWIDSYIGDDTNYNISYKRNYLKKCYDNKINNDNWLLEERIANIFLLYKILEIEYTGKNGTEKFLNLLSKLSTFTVKRMYILEYKQEIPNPIYQNLRAIINFILNFIFYNKASENFNPRNVPSLIDTITDLLKNELDIDELSFYEEISQIFLNYSNKEWYSPLTNFFIWKTPYILPDYDSDISSPEWQRWKLEFICISPNII